ncbi:MAG TPA: methylenetetrahydrofolate reductase [Sphingomicrobium sp.]|nr:methylenetetrahydrofolate reductase [Sphingomicrobium sp.]
MNIFRQAARTRDLCVSAELFLKPESTAETIAEQAKLLKDHVDGVLLTDNQFGQLHMSTLAAAALLIANDVDPIMQLSCRNRNRIALLSDLLGAGALGVTSLMLVKGNHVPEGFDPRPKAVLDVDATELIAMATRIRSDEGLPALSDFYVGGIVTPHRPDPEWTPRTLLRKIEAGVQFMMTNVCMDVPTLRSWLKHLVAGKILRRIDMIVSIATVESADDARWLCRNRPNFQIPEALIRRLEQARNAEQEGVVIAAEMVAEVAAIPGVSGVHLMATRNLAAIPAVLAGAGLSRQAV